MIASCSVFGSLTAFSMLPEYRNQVDLSSIFLPNFENRDSQDIPVDLTSHTHLNVIFIAGGGNVRKVGLFEARQKLSELVEQAAAGERIGITRRGKLVALIVPAKSQPSLAVVFKKLEGVRRRVHHFKEARVKELIEEG